MAAQARRFRWLDCNDMELFYTDAGLSMIELATMFRTNKTRVQQILKRMNVPIRARGDSSVNVIVDKDTHAVKGFRDKRDAASFARLQAVVRNDLEGFTLQAVGRNVVLTAPSIGDLYRLFDWLTEKVMLDEDPESLYSWTAGKCVRYELMRIPDETQIHGYRFDATPALSIPINLLDAVTR